MRKRTNDDSEKQSARPDLTGIILELREELALVEDAIRTFERIAAGQPTRRGGPPKWLGEAKRQMPPKD